MQTLYAHWTFVVLVMDLVPRALIDDEYATASEKDPKILLTTSRNPSAPLTQFVKVNNLFLFLWKIIFFSIVFIY